MVTVAQGLGHAGDGPLLGRNATQRVIRVAARTCLVGKAAELADGVCALVVHIAGHRRPRWELPIHAVLPGIGLPIDSVEWLVTVADGMLGRAGLIRGGRDLLREI